MPSKFAPERERSLSKVAYATAPPPRPSAAAFLRRRVPPPPPRFSAAAFLRRRVPPQPRLTADASHRRRVERTSLLFQFAERPAPASTARTFAARASGVNGFWRNAVVSCTPCCATASSV
jgi:hypothetical protein